jgi:hypothetical protein
MVELPASIEITDAQTSAPVTAQIVELSRSMAQREIDGKWWTIPDVSRSIRELEDDHHWRWAKLVGEHRNNLNWESVGILLGNGSIEGAMQYRIDAASFKNVDERAIFVDRLATAPHNRPWVVRQPRYRGVGEGLLLRAVVHSFVLGFDGRVTLLSFDVPTTIAFYVNRGFEVVGANEGLTMMEISPADARMFLDAHGYEL